MPEVPGSIPGFSKNKFLQQWKQPFSLFLVLLFSSFFCSKNAGSVSSLLSQNHCITITLHYTRTTTKVLVVHSLFQTAKKSKDYDFGVSDDSGNGKKDVL